MPRTQRLLPGVLFCLIIAAGAYFWATAMLDSLYVFRSPLHAAPPGSGEPLTSPLTRRAVVVLVDGLRHDTSLKPAVMPFLNELRAQGGWATMHSRPPSFSAPGYSVLFTGAWPDLSDGPALNLAYEEYTAWTQDNLFSAAHRAGLSAGVAAYNWFEKLIPQDAVTDGYYTAGDDARADRTVVDAALVWLRENRHTLTLIHLDQVDYAGHHEGGPRSPNWDAAARRADDLLREIAATLDFTQDTLIVFSDHGHITAGGHGGQDAITLVEPFVMVGAGVRPGQAPDMAMVDVAPTLAALLGVNLPASTQGRVLLEMLNVAPEHAARIEAATAAQQTQLAAAYGAGIGRTVATPAQLADVGAVQAAMGEARAGRLTAERLPRLAVALVWTLVFAVVLWRNRGRTLAGLFGAVVVYLLVFNLLYIVVGGGTYSLSSVTGSTALILGTAAYTLAGLLAGWAAFVALTGPTRRAPAAAAHAALAWVLLTLALTLLPALVSSVWNGPTAGWTLPEFALFFPGFLAVLQSLFIAAFGLPLIGLTALLARRAAQAQERVLTPA